MIRRYLLGLAVVVLILTLTCAPSRFAGFHRDHHGGARERQQGIARSMIFFIGDGMGPQIVSIAKIYSEESLEAGLNMVELANTGTAGYATTHSDDRLVTDSAASGTALATGFKTRNGVIGITPGGQEVENLFERAIDHGKSVGVITTTSVTDATPASFLAHVPSRGMHFEIAYQIVESGVTIVMGGGSCYFLPPDRGKRQDGRDLVRVAREKGFDVVFDKDDLAAAEGRRILGLFAPDCLPYERDRRAYETPSLSDMLAEALQLLSPDPDGFLLVVEGGRIDHAEHENSISDALGDFFAFDAAIGHAMNYQESDSTVAIMVTADHDCGGPAITATDYGYPSHDDLESLVGEDCPFVRWVSGEHTGTMVPVFARGPGADVFSGIQDNTDIHDNIVGMLGL
jgi:alkaline phosphatase